MSKSDIFYVTLTNNDLGKTGSHQSGIHLPKKIAINFPKLNPNEMNPRMTLTFKDIEKNRWDFEFIHYNNKLFGKGTRDEYRITRTTSFIREKMLENGSLMEVRKFLRLRIPANKSITKAIGIKEIKDLINKKLTYEQVIEKISIKTRQYAKRQTTWGRGHMSDWNKIKSNSLNQFLKKI